MEEPDQQEITQLLLAWGEGDEHALERLMPFVYDELRRLAGFHMRNQKVGHTLQATALVNEAYVRLIDSSRVRWQNRAHFFAMSSQLMRRVLVDFARAKNSQKRGGDEIKVTFDDILPVSEKKESQLIDLDEALNRLAEFSPRQAKIVEMRYFGGLTEEEIGEAINISSRTVRREWSSARAWLYREISN
jgi:RNA polymerase sigma factor (TIGR02999 family)